VIHDFPKHFRLRTAAEFERTFASEQFVADGVLVINGARNALEITRLGLSISRKFGNAVVRNRWKRLIREVFRLQLDQLPGGLDLIVRPKRGAVPNYQAIAQALPALVRRLDKRLPRLPASN
jgi:ribonuclease P protein component